jgi:hypothetical protein
MAGMGPGCATLCGMACVRRRAVVADADDIVDGLGVKSSTRGVHKQSRRTFLRRGARDTPGFLRPGVTVVVNADGIAYVVNAVVIVATTVLISVLCPMMRTSPADDDGGDVVCRAIC